MTSDMVGPLILIVATLVFTYVLLWAWTDEPQSSVETSAVRFDNDPQHAYWRTSAIRCLRCDCRPCACQTQLKPAAPAAQVESWVPPLLKAAQRPPSLANVDGILPGLERRDQESLNKWAWRIKNATGSYMPHWRLKQLLQQEEEKNDGK